MELVASSAFAVLLLAALVLAGPQRGLWVFFLATPFGAAAAVNLPAAGGASLLVADVAALALFTLVLVRHQGIAMMAGSMRFMQPGFWLLLYGAFAAVATLLFPMIFRGATEVFAISRDINFSTVISVPLAPSTGNLTQLFRLFLGLCVFYALATALRRVPDPRPVITAMAVAAGVNAALGWLDVAAFAVGLRDLLDPIRTANYAILDNVRMAGLKRMIGGYPEASSFGYFSLGLFAFWLQFWLLKPRARWAGVMVIVTMVAVLRSTSSAAYVSFAAFMFCFTVAAILRNLRSRISRRGFALLTVGFVATWFICIFLAAAYELLDPVRAFFDRSLFGKLEGASGVERLSWNTQAFQNFLDTWGLGTGLGSVRASSWLFATLASVGWIGTLLFALFLGSLFTLRQTEAVHGDGDATLAALKAACFAWLLSSMLTNATPDLGLSFFACAGVAAGLSRGSILAARRLRQGQENSFAAISKQYAH